MLSERMQAALNDQINEELYSSYLYLSMSAYLAEQDLNGAAHWTALQAQEELMHAKKLYDYVVERGGRVLLQAIKGPKTEWDSPRAVFEDVYEHECHITGCINKLVDLALEERDHGSNNFLQWFVAEQVEEEAHADEVRKQFRFVENAPGGMFMLDRELGARVLAPETTAE